MKLRLLLSIAAFFFAACSTSHAAVTVFQDDLAGFSAAAGTQRIIEFNGLNPGTDLAGITFSGITFSSPPGNTLEVVGTGTTITPGGFSTPGDGDNQLFSTFPNCATKLLSPGGTGLVPGSNTAEKDGLRMVFNTPLRSFGINVHFQALDGASFTDFYIRDRSGALIASGHVNIPFLGNGPDTTSSYSQGGGVFIGFHSDQADIAEIEFDEFDGDAANPDSNIGYDTIRIVVPRQQGSGPYVFTNIADNNCADGIDGIGESPAINDAGIVVFHANINGPGLFARSVAGGPTVTVASFAGDFSQYFGPPAVNDAGTVAFAALRNTGEVGIFAGSSTAGGAPATVADSSSGMFFFVESPALNGAGAVVFEADSQPFGAARGIYLDNVAGGNTTTLLDDSGMFGFPAGNPEIGPALNDAGTVAFFATRDSGGEGIFSISSSGGLVTTLADTNGGDFTFFGSPVINNSGTVAFRAGSAALGGEGIFTTASSGGTPSPVADTAGAFSNFVTVAINDSGTVAFLANLDITGGPAIFTGPDVIADRVIGVGDQLFAGTVGQSVNFAKAGFNNQGQVVFRYFINNGPTGIAVATPNVRVSSLTPLIGGFQISIVGAPNVTYTIRFSDLLSAGFNFLTTVTTNASGTASYTDLAAGTQRFYIVTFP